MVRIFVDTCVWRHWFTFREDPDKLSKAIRDHSQNFDFIYRAALSSGNVELLFSSLVEHELGGYKKEFSGYIIPVARRVAVPFSRFDGLYSADGSVLHGGRMGGKLRCFLEADGYPQDAKVSEAAAGLNDGARLYETKPRRRELDVEHMESALEVMADMFITNDEKTIIEPLARIGGRYSLDHPINLIRSITRTPTSALPSLQNYLNP